MSHKSCMTSTNGSPALLKTVTTKWAPKFITNVSVKRIVVFVTFPTLRSKKSNIFHLFVTSTLGFSCPISTLTWTQIWWNWFWLTFVTGSTEESVASLKSFLTKSTNSQRLLEFNKTRKTTMIKGLPKIKMKNAICLSCYSQSHRREKSPKRKRKTYQNLTTIKTKSRDCWMTTLKEWTKITELNKTVII